MARHFPAERDGCYYQRIVDCCWLCYGRMLLDGFKSRLG